MRPSLFLPDQESHDSARSLPSTRERLHLVYEFASVNKALQRSGTHKVLGRGRPNQEHTRALARPRAEMQRAALNSAVRRHPPNELRFFRIHFLGNSASWQY